MNNVKLYRVKVKSSGKILTVYKLVLGGYCDSSNHTTSYSEENLIFLEETDDNNKFTYSTEVKN